MSLKGKKIAVLAENMYDERELWYPAIRLREGTQRVQGILHFDRRNTERRRIDFICPNQERAGAFGDRLIEKVVRVEALTFERDEQMPAECVPSVGGNTGQHALSVAV